MAKQVRILYWVGVVVAPIVSYYAFGSFIFYAWMNANGAWPAERATTWAYPSLALSIIFFGLFVWCVWRLVRLTNHSSGQTPRNMRNVFEIILAVSVALAINFAVFGLPILASIGWYKNNCMPLGGSINCQLMFNYYNWWWLIAILLSPGTAMALMNYKK